jgi:alpha-1,2-mannosyltransferase
MASAFDRPWVATFAVLAVVSAVLVYYRMEFGSVTRLVAAVDHGESLFDDLIRHWYRVGQTVFETGAPSPGYFYTAFFALLLTPLGRLAWPQVFFLWGALQIALAALLCLLSGWGLVRISNAGRILFVLLFMTSLPLLHNFSWGQVSTLIAGAMLGSLWLYRNGRPNWSAILLAFAVAIKYYPAILLAYPLSRRDYRFLAVFGGAFLGFYCLLPALVMGPSAWLAFENATRTAILEAGWITDDVNSQYFPRVVLRLLGIGSAGNAPVLSTTLAIVGALLLLVNVATVFALRRRSESTSDSLLASAVILLLSLPFVLKTSWPHYFTFLPFCQLAILVQAKPLTGPPRTVVRILAAVSIALASVPFFRLFPSWIDYSTYGMLFFANLVLLAAQHALVLVGHRHNVALPQGDAIAA